ncbi:unnamed protein product [Mytilus edulis]|uniref:CARD domain-containing protein n=1 Tax=Mytilus edulis TaxID=6550 RepID=A0A8S3TAB8_MYTED|nr:unnamed protein product [Mytilus edulis]
MKLLYKKVLDYLLTKKDYFYKNLTLTGGLLDELLEKDIIDEVENVDIRGTDKGSRSEKIELLIRIIMVKDDNTYELFKKCLLESHAFVVTKMEKKENKLNTQCEECNEYIQQLLQYGYSCAEADSVVAFEEIQNDIIHNVRGSSRHHDTLLGVLDENFMIDCILRAFPKAKSLNYLCREQPDIAKTNFNVDEFPILVEEILREHTKDWDQTICQKIRDQRIDSEVYGMMDDNDKKRSDSDNRRAY